MQRCRRPLPKRVRVKRLTQEQKDLFAQRKWTAFLESLDVGEYYRVPTANFYDKGIIHSVAGNINGSDRKPKEFDVYDPPADFSVIVHVVSASVEKIRASKRKIKTFMERRTEYFRLHKWKKLLALLTVGVHRFKYESVYDAVKFQKWAWDANSRGGLDRIFRTRIDYEKKRLTVTVMARQPEEPKE